ncbi:cytochrome d ubiquinol oxidase subunit II [Paenibacillus sp. MER TA 81-3]|uniref:cytochrome d ubiquinol oxidase subunit II n=1 Tax=Paenibacillus sp. MER TA 81-3 TaxID=2939573 RepID=UPI00203C3CF0|nr:cytochrome d ubiquinol oxidase subunit II [Paenibacillus sp. MER TA 81-3]MCM3340916.1 cytochrome d ubiquinol oxidase subunit II [Paenibacillus sp. MER TA 81-3]
MLSLNELWFILVSVLFVGFFFLEGFDFGVGIVSRFLGKSDQERRILINTIGPYWDANEVWLITAGGAMFAAFPEWYATLFSGFYIPFVVLLLALIARGVAFEFRGKMDHGIWKKTWDAAIFIGSLLPPFLFGVVFANLIRGVPIDSHKEMIGSVFDLLNGYALAGGVAVVLLCILHGLVFITLRTNGDLRDRARKAARDIGPAVAAVLLIFAVMTYFSTDIYTVHGAQWIALPVLAGAALVLAGLFIKKKRDGWAFAMTGAVIILSVVSMFIGLFPRVMVSSISPDFHLTIYNAASGAYSLKVMTYISLTILPFVLGYQIWSYYVFRKRIDDKEHLEY